MAGIGGLVGDTYRDRDPSRQMGSWRGPPFIAPQLCLNVEHSIDTPPTDLSDLRRVRHLVVVS